VENVKLTFEGKRASCSDTTDDLDSTGVARWTCLARTGKGAGSFAGSGSCEKKVGLVMWDDVDFRSLLKAFVDTKMEVVDSMDVGGEIETELVTPAAPGREHDMA
jgi:hypothetical protein